MTPIALRVAAGLLWFSAVGFGVPCLIAIRSLAAGRDVPTVMGFPAYGGGPFERHGIQSSVWLVAAFLVVCVLEGVAGALVWNGRLAGGVLAVATLPFGALFWWGFALPIAPLLALARTVLILLSWRDLR